MCFLCVYDVCNLLVGLSSVCLLSCQLRYLNTLPLDLTHLLSLQVSPLVLAHARANGREELLSPPLKDVSPSRSSPRDKTRDGRSPPTSDSPLVRHSSPSSVHSVQVFTSAQHSIQPSDTETEDTIPTFSLSRKSISNSLHSDVDPDSFGYEGADL